VVRELLSREKLPTDAATGKKAASLEYQGVRS
jgi:hypothetical protein